MAMAARRSILDLIAAFPACPFVSLRLYLFQNTHVEPVGRRTYVRYVQVVEHTAPSTASTAEPPSAV